MRISSHLHEVSIGAPSVANARCTLDLDGAISTLYGYGGHLAIGRRRIETVSEVMRVLAEVREDQLERVAAEVSRSLRDAFLVSTSFNRSLWMSNGHAGNGKVPSASPKVAH